MKARITFYLGVIVAILNIIQIILSFVQNPMTLTTFIGFVLFS
jgi:hypothetical protein